MKGIQLSFSIHSFILRRKNEMETKVPLLSLRPGNRTRPCSSGTAGSSTGNRSRGRSPWRTACIHRAWPSRPCRRSKAVNKVKCISYYIHGNSFVSSSGAVERVGVGGQESAKNKTNLRLGRCVGIRGGAGFGDLGLRGGERSCRSY